MDDASELLEFYKIFQDSFLDKLENDYKISKKDYLKIRNYIKYDNYSEDIYYKLLGNIIINADKGCWFRSKDWSYYSNLRIEKQVIGAHRISYEIFKGPLIFGKEICHHCDRKGCINPFHLFQGSHSDNINDGRRKHRVFSPSFKKKRIL